MDYQLFQHPCLGLGSVTSVWIDSSNRVVKRVFSTELPIVSGGRTKLTDEEVEACFKNELYWLTKLKDRPYIPKLIDVEESNKTIFQEYCGPDLLILKEREGVALKGLSDRFLDIHKDLVKNFGLLKLNHSLSNMALVGSSIRLFDFKWAVKIECHGVPSKQPMVGCKTALDDEFYSYENFMIKFDPSILDALKAVVELEIRKQS